VPPWVAGGRCRRAHCPVPVDLGASMDQTARTRVGVSAGLQGGWEKPGGGGATKCGTAKGMAKGRGGTSLFKVTAATRSFSSGRSAVAVTFSCICCGRSMDGALWWRDGWCTCNNSVREMDD
jgi:hypothetical protein